MVNDCLCVKSFAKSKIVVSHDLHLDHKFTVLVKCSEIDSHTSCLFYTQIVKQPQQPNIKSILQLEKKKIELIEMALQTLISTVKGPCRENQTSMLRTKILDIVNKI